MSVQARPEFLRDLRLRRLHVMASVLAAVLFLMQGATGTRDLLEIPLRWHKPAVYECDFVLRSCPYSVMNVQQQDRSLAWNSTLERIVLLADLLLKALKQGQYGRFIGMLCQNHQMFGVGVRLEVVINLPGQWLSYSHLWGEISQLEALSRMP